jgi:hypothetical protein
MPATYTAHIVLLCSLQIHNFGSELVLQFWTELVFDFVFKYTYICFCSAFRFLLVNINLIYSRNYERKPFQQTMLSQYHSIQNLLFSSLLLSKNVKISMYKTIILSVVLYGCETWSLTLMEEHRLRVFENRVLWTEEGWGDGRMEKIA